MFKLIRFLAWVAVLGAFVWFGSTVNLGTHTLFGHFAQIWRAKETQQMVHEAKQKAGPAVDRAKRAVQAGVDEVEKQ